MAQLKKKENLHKFNIPQLTSILQLPWTSGDNSTIHCSHHGPVVIYSIIDIIHCSYHGPVVTAPHYTAVTMDQWWQHHTTLQLPWTSGDYRTIHCSYHGPVVTIAQYTAAHMNQWWQQHTTLQLLWTSGDYSTIHCSYHGPVVTIAQYTAATMD